MTTTLDWTTTSPTMHLEPGEVHIWRAALDLAEDKICRFSKTLLADEITRAKRFRFEKDRLKFIVSRGILREILGYYLRIAPHTLAFGYNAYGKPYLNVMTKRDPQRSIPNFNVSHAYTLVLYAIAQDMNVGIDVEYNNSTTNLDTITQHFFSPEESAALQDCDADTKRARFYTIWTRKEAYLKARGQGFAYPMNKANVLTQLPRLNTRFPIEDAERNHVWWGESFIPAPSYYAAIVTDGEQWITKYWQYKS